MATDKRVLSNSIYHATKWSAITNVMRKMISPVTNMILARLLAPDAFGVVATINIVISFAEIFADAGFQKYLVQHEFNDEEGLFKSANVAFWTNFLISICLFVVIAAFSERLAAWVGSEGYGRHLMVASLVIPLVSFSSIQQSLFRRNFDFKGMFWVRLINSLLPLFVTIPLAYILRNCWALILGTLIGKLSDALLLTIKSKWKPKLYYSIGELKEMLSFSLWTLLESLSIWLTLNIDVFILGQLVSSYYLGLYKTSIVSVGQITNLITTTIIPVLFSALARCQNDIEVFKQTVYSFQQKAAILLLPMSVGICIYSDLVTWILLGEQWMEASNLVGMIGFIQVFVILYANFASEVYRALGEPRVSFFVQLGYIILVVPAIYWGASSNFEVLCLTKMFLMLCFILINMLVLKFRYAFGIRKMLLNIGYSVPATIAMAVVGYLLNRKINTVVGKGISIGICITVYLLGSMLVPKTRETILGIIKKRKLV